MYQDDNYSHQMVIEDYYQQPRKKNSKRGQALTKGFLSFFMVIAICLLSITGYVWFSQLPEEPTLAALGSNQSITADPSSKAININYVLGSTEEALTVPEIYIKVLPSVVSITCEVEVTMQSFGFFGGQQQPQTQTSIATGTGIVMTADGYIMTNHHVVDGAINITVTTHDGIDYPATLIGSDEKSDIAVLKVSATSLSPAEFGDSTQLLVGEAAIVIGNPLGTNFAGTLTQGVISSVERNLTNTIYDGTDYIDYIMSYIQTDAAVNPGNSGGPLINSRGQIVGVVNSKISQNDVEGIGFAIPTNLAIDIAYDLIEHGTVTIRPALGITVRAFTEEEAPIFNQYYANEITAGTLEKAEPGIIVTEVAPGSTADVAGVLPGDKIIAFNSIKSDTVAELNLAKEKCKIGDKATLTVIRNGQELVLDLILQGAN